MRTAGRLGWAALFAVAIAACSDLPATNKPSDAVRGAVVATVAHDLAAAASHVCPEGRGLGPLPFIIEGITGAVDGLPFEDGFALITFDATGLTIGDEEIDGDIAQVSLSGTLVEIINPARYEAEYRASVAASGETIDQALLDQVLGLINGGRYELPVDQTVRVVRKGGTWQVCELAPTP